MVAQTLLARGGGGGVEVGTGGAPSSSGGTPSAGGSSGGASAGGRAGNGAGGAMVPCPSRELVGFGSVMNGTPGGSAGKTVRANTADELKAYVAAEEPLIIEIATTLALSDQLRPKPNKTIVGLGTTGVLTGAGFYIKNSENIVIQNLTITKLTPGDNDAIGIENSRYVWVDHCDLSTSLDDPVGTYDGLVDITHASDFVTVSWSRMHDHYGVSVIGHSDTNADEDTGHLRVTMHHNYFQNVISATPRVRFGKVHLFNNYFENVGENAVLSLMGADVVLERNYFIGVPMPLVTHFTGDDGNATSVDDVFDQSGAPMITSASTWDPSSAYAYRDGWDSASSVPTIVARCAGVGTTK